MTFQLEMVPEGLAEFEANGPEDLVEFGRLLGRWLPSMAVLILSGELGAGKTTLMKGIAEGLNLAQADDVTSPSYTLIHEYHRGARSLYHLDLYRIDSGAQAATLGLEDILAPAEGKVVAIEWGEKLGATLPPPYLHAQLTILTDGRHRVTVAVHD